MSKHLDFYYKCLEKKRMPSDGLCDCADMGLLNKKIFNLFLPSESERVDGNWLYWASGSGNWETYEFTPLRQNIVLLMACLNGEL
jgi:hypothetical protein